MPKPISKSNFIKYAYTVKVLGTKQVATPAIYSKFFENMASKVFIESRISEFDKSSRKVLHYHGIFTARTGFYIPLIRFKGFHLYVDPLRSETVWRKYCCKDCTSKGLKKLF